MKKSILVCLLILLVCSLSLVACAQVDFEITFVVNDVDYATINTCGKEVVAIPQNPTKDGYTFEGWYWDNGTWQRPFTASSLLDEPLTADMKVYAKFVENHQHDYAEVVTSATYTEGGCTTFTCDCGHSYVGNQVEALGHKFTNYISDNNATYEQNGTKTATCQNGCGKTDTVTDIGSMLVRHVISFKTLTTSNNGTVYGKVPNGTTTFSFLNEVVTQGNATYGVYLDIICSQEVKSKTVNLVTGDNTFYIWAEDTDNGDVLYTVTIRVKPLYTVTFDTLGGSTVTSQTVEDDAFATRPTTTKTGYTFVAWDYDFTQPITQNKTITASWQANTYTVNFDGNGGNNPENIAVTYDDNYNNLPIPTRTGYAFDGWFTAKDGGTQITKETQVAITENQTLYAHWTINQYKLSITKNIDGAGTITQNVENGKQNYGTEITFKLDSTNLGYEYLGLYDGENLITTENTYSFTIPASDISYVAKWQVKDEMSNFRFSSTTTTCSIDGIINKEITEIVVPYGVTSIGEWAFSNCSRLTSIKIPDSVTTIGNGACRGCSSLENLILPFVGQNASTSNENNLPFGHIFGGVSYDGSIETTQRYLRGQYTTNTYYIPASLKNVTITGGKILNGAFYNCSMLEKIIIPNDISAIGGYAFYNCDSLLSITIPENIISIGDSAFDNCSKLKSVNISNIANWCNISYGTVSSNPLYYACNLYINGTLVTNLIIPDGVTTIKYAAFVNCNGLSTIIIPNSLTTIEYIAFKNCNNLTSVYYNGTEQQYNNITIANDNTPLTSATIYYYSKQEPLLNTDGTDYDGNYWYYDGNNKPIIWKKKENL